jgi:glycogen(starch) synthase
MRILLISYAYSPSIGGIEKCSEMLSSAFESKGHEVIIVTHTSSSTDQKMTILRKPNLYKLICVYQWADIVFFNNLSLKYIWPLFFIQKPLLITHQTWLAHGSLYSKAFAYLKKTISCFGKNVSLSKSLATQLWNSSIVIGNPYDEKIFYRDSSITKTKEVLFVGRLVSDKGVDLALEAIKKCHEIKHLIHLTIVGSGEESERLKGWVDANKLSEYIHFLGIKQGKELAKIYNEHQIVIVPSKWEEPFGIVALEAIACGCYAIVSNKGGLPEAIGTCGATFLNLEDLVLKLINNLTLKKDLPETLDCLEHLNKFSIDAISHRYLKLFSQLCNDLG